MCSFAWRPIRGSAIAVGWRKRFPKIRVFQYGIWWVESMTGDVDRLRVLITVMTYPHPKESHDEVVCTAGVTDAGEWVRLFPIDYRYRPKQQQIHTYQ